MKINENKIFDVVIGNPPYKQGLHLRFLEKFIHISSQYVVSIEPVYFLVNTKQSKRKHIEIRLYRLLEKYGFYLQIFNGNNVFKEAYFMSVLGYIILDKINYTKLRIDNKNNNEIYFPKNISEIHTFGDSKIYPDIKRKILKVAIADNVEKYRNKENGNFYINFASIRGHINENAKMFYKNDFFSVVSMKENVKTFKDNSNFIAFKTEIEANNFLNYIKTNFSRFALTIYKVSSNQTGGELAAIPYLDYSRSWTDQELYTHFNLTKDEINFIEKHIPKYHED